MKIIRPLLVGAVVASLASSAEAALIEFQDVFTPNPAPTLSDSGESYQFNHYITLQAVQPGTNVLTTRIDSAVVPGADYDPGTDTLTQGMLTLFFSHSGGPPDTQGRFDLFLDEDQFLDNHLFTSTVVSIGTAQFNVGLLALDGILTVLLERTNAPGEVLLTSSVLAVNGLGGEPSNENQTGIPEPSSLLLFGTAALAAGHRLRRRTVG